ncbi:MAG TPA: hypothetical protein ENF95_01610 [Candidatus Aenigmarchaeota archaeon]|nr:hypothetical protein [Candidatus Aenigmarchaeota archaeon]
MKIKILEVKENPLMKRKELKGIIEHEGMPTPSKASVQMYLAKEQGVPPKHVDVRKIFSAEGREDARLIAYIWEEKEVPVLEEKKEQKGEAKEGETKPEEKEKTGKGKAEEKQEEKAEGESKSEEEGEDKKE